MLGCESGLLLLTAIGGYWVMERADTHKGQLKRVGTLLGTAIIILSLFGIVVRGWTVCRWTRAHGGGGPACPFMPKPAGPEAAPSSR